MLNTIAGVVPVPTESSIMIRSPGNRSVLTALSFCTLVAEYGYLTKLQSRIHFMQCSCSQLTIRLKNQTI